MKHKEALELTDSIMEEILYHQNGYSKEDIKNKELAKACRGSEIYEAILTLLTPIPPHCKK